MTNTSIELYQSHRATFDRYQSLLLKWNQKINLTAITAPHEIVEKHFLDSLALIDVSRETFFQGNVPRETLSVLDIGSGGGFPGLPLKIALPSLHMSLLDATKKRCDFLKEAIRSLSLSSIQVLQETLTGQSVGLFDVIVTRATFSLSQYLALAIPNLKPQGAILAMKGLEIDDEIREAQEALKDSDFKSFAVLPYELMPSQQKRQIILVKR